MGLESSEQLRSFCLELSSDKPSPGGGTAAASAGAMAASLLVMVCRITGKSKKFIEAKRELDELRTKLENQREELIMLASEDARAYDLVVDAIRTLRSKPGEEATAGLQTALKHASEVPLRTASACLEILRLSERVAQIGTPSASSDVGVAVLLAESGFRGADMNVRINLKEISDPGFVSSAKDALRPQEEQAKLMASKTFHNLKGL